MKYHITTYGCQMNHSDSERIAAILEKSGYQAASTDNEADLIVVNACSVRQSAIDRIWGETKKFQELKTINHKLKTILTGCVLPADKKKLAERFDLILGIKDLPQLPKNLLAIKQFNNLTKKRREGNKDDYLRIKPKYAPKFSVSIPITTGCDNFCTYCAVPYTRGGEISRPAENILCEAEHAINPHTITSTVPLAQTKRSMCSFGVGVKNGAKEIWLLGQNVNSYRGSRLTAHDKQQINFPDLLKMVNNIPGDFWIRFTSPHPKDFSDELITTMVRCEKVTPYLNLPVQSGDNMILKKMNRPYTVEHYKNLVKKIRENIPDIAISTDVIVGFPGETKKQFENTAKLFREIKFDMGYISKFSPRPGTPAAKMDDNVPHREKEKRWKILTDILRKTASRNNKKYIGKTVTVLVENKRENYLIGKSEHYKTVKFSGNRNLVGQFARIKIVDALPWGIKGEVAN